MHFYLFVSFDLVHLAVTLPLSLHVLSSLVTDLMRMRMSMSMIISISMSMRWTDIRGGAATLVAVLPLGYLDLVQDGTHLLLDLIVHMLVQVSGTVFLVSQLSCPHVLIFELLSPFFLVVVLIQIQVIHIGIDGSFRLSLFSTLCLFVIDSTGIWAVICRYFPTSDRARWGKYITVGLTPLRRLT